MEAYINKDNRVVHIAPTKADEIQPNSKGKLLFTEGVYDPNTMKYTHVLGRGEEVFVVPAEGLSLGDVYIEHTETPEVGDTVADQLESIEAEEVAAINDLALARVIEREKASEDFQREIGEL